MRSDIVELIEADAFRGLGVYYKAMHERDYLLAMQVCSAVQNRLGYEGKSSRTDEYKEWTTRRFTARDLRNPDIWFDVEGK